MRDHRGERMLMSVSEASRYTGYGREMIEYWIDRCGLPFEQPPTPGRKNRFRRIRKADLDAFLETHYRREPQRQERVQENEREKVTLLPKISFTSRRKKANNSTCGSHAASR